MTPEQENAVKIQIAKAVVGRLWQAIPDLQNKDFAVTVARLITPVRVTDADIAEMERNPDDSRIARLVQDLANQAQKKIIETFVEQGAKPVRR